MTDSAPPFLPARPVLATVLLAVAVLRMVWQLDAYAPALGFLLLAAMALHGGGLARHIPEYLCSLWRSFVNSPRVMNALGGRLKNIRLAGLFNAGRVASILIPLVLVGIFLFVFGLANPLVQDWINRGSEWLGNALADISDWIVPGPWQALLWITGLLAACMLLRPTLARPQLFNRMLGPGEELNPARYANPDPGADTAWTVARNTLIGLNLLFLAYNATDATYLWVQRELPEGIDFAHYARGGAAWLTVALAMTSMTLGAMFCGRLNFHARAGLLKGLSWLWIAQNAFLALSTYKRLWIYIDFNGLTRWRQVGAFGITAVAVGLAVVALKMRGNKSFLWMVRRQLAALALGLCLLAVWPLDYVAMAYNARQINAGNVGPAMQLRDQPLTAEGLPPLISLIRHETPEIRRGAAGILLREHNRLRDHAKKYPRWTYREAARARALKLLDAVRGELEEIAPPGWEMEDAVKNLRSYTKPYEWPGRPLDESEKEFYRKRR